MRKRDYIPKKAYLLVGLLFVAAVMYFTLDSFAYDWVFYTNGSGTDIDIQFLNNSQGYYFNTGNSVNQPTYLSCLSWNSRVICAARNSGRYIYIYNTTDDKISNFSRLSHTDTIANFGDTIPQIINRRYPIAASTQGSSNGSFYFDIFDQKGYLISSQVIETPSSHDASYFTILNPPNSEEYYISTHHFLGTDSKGASLLGWNGTAWAINITLSLNSSANNFPMVCPDINSSTCILYYNELNNTVAQGQFEGNQSFRFIYRNNNTIPQKWMSGLEIPT